MSADPTVIHLDAAHLTVEPPPGFRYPEHSLALVAFPEADRLVVLSGSLDDLRDVAAGILGMVDELACTCPIGGVDPECPTHGGDE